MAHYKFSSFCLKLDLVTAPVEQCAVLVERDLDWHLRWGKAMVWPVPATPCGVAWSWLSAGTMGLAGPAPLCIKNPKGQVGWTVTGLCQIQTLKHAWKAWNNVWVALPTGTLWVCGSHGWPYLPRKWTGHCT